MKRAMSVWFPALPIDRLRRADRRRASQGASPDGPRDGGGDDDLRPVLLVSRDGQRQVVSFRCAQAAKVGVRVGMPASEARAVFPTGGVRIEAFNPERDAAALRSLATWAHRFSPLVAADPPDGLLLDVTGCERIFRGEDRLLRQVTERARRVGYEARAAIASTFGCAWALARFGRARRVLVPDGREREKLAPLPVAALRIDADIEKGLRDVGVERVEQLLALPRSALPSRFGPDLLLRLDQALGRAMESIEPIRPAAPLREERVFDGATTQWEAIELTLRELLERLCARLEAQERGARLAHVELVRIDMTPARESISLNRPSRDAKHLWSLLRPRMERVNLGFGVEEVSVTAARTDLVRHAQAERWRRGISGEAGDGPSARASGELIDTLANRLGNDRVLAAEIVETHSPRRAARLRPAGEAMEKMAKRWRAQGRSRGRAASPSGARTSATVARGDRPSLLFDRPAPVDVVALMPEGPAHELSWRGERVRIVRSVGPERIGGEWWRGRRGGRGARDYFKAQDEHGRWLWLYREVETGRWFVHGVWA